jgi:alkylation response protein AidB-like acyl-CoA dehydrogenase
VAPVSRLPGAFDSARVLTAVAAEALGVAERALELAVAYVTERQQFGRAIGVYQAVAHPVADSFCDIELTRSLPYAAAWKLDKRPGKAPTRRRRR